MKRIAFVAAALLGLPELLSETFHTATEAPFAKLPVIDGNSMGATEWTAIE